MKKVILIGGAPGTGKSTIAQNLSKELDLPWISTDQLRGIVRDYAVREQYPDLLLPEGLDTAETFLANLSAEKIADMEYQQAYDVWPAVSYVVNETYGWKDGVIIEGVNIIPELINEHCADKSNVQAFFVIDEDQDRLHDVVYGRGIWDDADAYADELKPKEVDWVNLFTQKLKASAEKFNYSLVEVQKDESDMIKVRDILEG